MDADWGRTLGSWILGVQRLHSNSRIMGSQMRREPHGSRPRVSNENKEADDGGDYAESWISIVLGRTLSMEWAQTQQTIHKVSRTVEVTATRQRQLEQ